MLRQIWELFKNGASATLCVVNMIEAGNWNPSDRQLKYKQCRLCDQLCAVVSVVFVVVDNS